jgi:hypothetical protein
MACACRRDLRPEIRDAYVILEAGPGVCWVLTRKYGSVGSVRHAALYIQIKRATDGPELDNLDKDADSRRAAMKALKSYARHLDSKSIPHFLAEVSDTKAVATPGSPSGEFTIALYEVLARNIVPQVGNIMATIMCTLSSSGGSLPLHQACSKVVAAIPRYGIDPSTPDEKKAAIDADPFCLCYVADGTFARATGTDVARALQIPVSCGQVAPPIEFCSSKSRRPASHSRVLSSVHVHDDFSFSDLFD